MVHEDIVERSLEELKKILKMPGISKLPFEVKDYDDVVVAAKHVVSGRIVPIFKVSNVTGEGLELLRKFLNILPPRMRWKERVNSSLLMYVDDIFNVKGVGPVVAGLLLSGSVHVDDKVLIGPLRDGSWRKVRVKSIHINRVFVKRAQAGIEATLALSGIEFEDLEKGMAVIDDGRKPLSVREFNAKVTILKHPTTIRKGYEAVLHLGAIRSTVKFVKLEKECMRTGDTGIVTLKFVHHPWYIRSQDVFVIRDARTRAIGKVLKIVSVG
ncbi:MAG TPA: elongation factor 1-alpha, partial [Thermofilum sp.]|nr:elongation factor 1-alpha [Thermofilum sp.]